jgi:hypothetical protein
MQAIRKRITTEVDWHVANSAFIEKRWHRCELGPEFVALYGNGGQVMDLKAKPYLLSIIIFVNSLVKNSGVANCFHAGKFSNLMHIF